MRSATFFLMCRSAGWHAAADWQSACSGEEKRVITTKARCSFLLLTLVLLTSCGSLQRNRAAIATTGGDPGSGSAAITHYGCGSCHTIPGVTGANGLAGPPLASLRHRTYIAGGLPNSTDNLMRWVEHPLSIHQKSAMPELGVTAKDARDIAAYLYSLK